MSDMRVLAILVALVSLLAAAAASGSPPPYTDADVLGLEISGELLAPGALVSEIAADLDAIRIAFPVLADIHVFPTWVPGVIHTKLSAQAYADYQGGVFHDFNALNAQYGPVTITPTFAYWLKLEFEALYHPEVLAAIYEQVAGIESAEPNHFLGDGSDITAAQQGMYTFKRGWGDDCPSGCSYQHFWEFAVSDGNVTLLAEYGTALGTGVGDMPPGAIAFLAGNVPNPFSGTTEIGYRVESPADVELRIYDVAGRLVKQLHSGFLPPGVHAARWDGTNETGRRVSSGVYFCSLVANDVTHTRKLLLTR